MRLPADAIIAREKMTRYLLRRQERGDKSAFLARAGHTFETADQEEPIPAPSTDQSPI
jgi:hypothetical protein